MTASSPQWTGLAAALVESERYRPLQRLGKKAGRQTLLCEDRETGQRVVIKLLSFGEDFAWQDLKLFEREAETLRSLDHPAIPKYLDYFDLETPRTKGFALVQSHIEAQSLEQQLKAGRSFSEAEIQQIGEDLLNILEYLHGRQPPVIHRDIKPSNILLGDRSAHSPGQVYLVDFGSVQTLAAREGSTITVVGTYGYMPPEQFGGRAVPASDLYSLGATLIYLASGRHPADLPQKDFRIQFEDMVNLTAPTVAWLQLLIEPRLERRASSTEVASLSCIQVSTTTTQSLKNIEIETAKTKPALSKIKATYDSQGALILKLPPKKVALYESGNSDSEKKAFFQKVFSLGKHFRDEYFKIFLVFATFSTLSILIFLLIEYPVIVVLLFMLRLAWFFAFRNPSMDIKILIKSQEVQVFRPCQEAMKIGHKNVWGNQEMQRFTRNDAWGISPFPEMKLFLGTHELAFSGTKKELLWLELLLRNELDLTKEDRA